MPIKPQEIATLIELFNTSDWDELHVEIDGLQLFLSTNPNARLSTGAAAPAAPILQSAPAPTQTTAPKTITNANDPIPANWVPVKAPNLGTFYRAPKPGAAPFVEIGQHVNAETEICIIEVMKLFTALKAGTAGIIRKICVNEAEMVEFGQILFYIEPT